MVAGDGAPFCKEIVGFFHCQHQVRKRLDLHAPAAAQFCKIFFEIGLADLHDPVRTPCGTHQHFAESGVGAFVIFQCIGRIVRGTHHFNIHTADEGLGLVFVFRQRLAAALPEFFGSFGAKQNVVESEEPQIQVDPFIHGIARKFGEDFRHGDPLCVVIRILSGDEFFADAPFAEHFPHIMIGGGKKFPGIGEGGIVGDPFHISMVVSVDDRQFCHGAVKRLCRLGTEKIIVVQKCHGFSFRCFHFNGNITHIP